MAYKYKHFIPQNIAPNGAKNIGVYNSNGEKIYTIPLGRLTPLTKEKLYSFGLVSDIHIAPYTTVAWLPETKFDNALTYFENKGCSMCIATGDLTQTGYYLRTQENTAGTEYFDERQMRKYRETCDKHTIPVYEIAGNHESHYNVSITKSLDLWQTDTEERDLSYTVEQGNDLFVFVGQPTAGTVLESLQWLYETLETNRNKRCFVFIHPWLTNDSGNPLSAVTNNVFTMWQNNTGNRNLETVFKNLMTHYKNAVLFHGHSHMKFEMQEFDEYANYTEKNGFKSIHIPSASRPRIVDLETNKAIDNNADSQCYLVDVYDDYIILSGVGLTGVTSDNISSKQYQPSPLGTYKIDTPLVTVEANTFTDSTGTIVT